MTHYRILSAVIKKEKEIISWKFKKTIAWGRRAKWHEEQKKIMRFLELAESDDLELEHGLMEQQARDCS